jgi:hypothetical protein
MVTRYSRGYLSVERKRDVLQSEPNEEGSVRSASLHMVEVRWGKGPEKSAMHAVPPVEFRVM